jgi:DNA-binding response OmpR family regulator
MTGPAGSDRAGSALGGDQDFANKMIHTIRGVGYVLNPP